MKRVAPKSMFGPSRISMTANGNFSRDGGSEPRWSSGGKELLFTSPFGGPLSSDIEILTGESINRANFFGNGNRSIDQRFLLRCRWRSPEVGCLAGWSTLCADEVAKGDASRLRSKSTSSIVFVDNWFEELSIVCAALRQHELPNRVTSGEISSRWASTTKSGTHG